MDDKAVRITESIDGMMNAAIEEGACRAVAFVAEGMMWEFRHVLDDDGATTWGDVAPMICLRFAGQAPMRKLMDAVRRAISPLTLDDLVTARRGWA